MNWDLLSIIVFYGLLFLFFLKHKKDFTIQGKIFALYKTKLGLKAMDRLANIWPRAWNVIGLTGVGVGFLGMAFIFYFLVKETLKLVFVPGTEPALAPVLPGIQIPGAPTLSFWHWIITIFIAAVIHEFSHGVIARLHKVNVKSSGFAFLGPILAAFVEPEEKELEKKSKAHQLSVFAAGPFSNIILAALVLLFTSFAFNPLVSGLYDTGGVIVNDLVEGYPMAETGIETPFTITAINGQQTLSFMEFVNVTDNIMPGQVITLTTDKGEYTVTTVPNPDNASRPFIGISGLEQNIVAKEQYASAGAFLTTIQWLQLLLLWLFIINLGIGLFNLLPLGPVDGGRMFYVLSLGIFKTESRAKKALMTASIICLGLIVINMIPWLNKFFVWIWGIITALVALV